MKTECDYLNGWIKKRSHTQKSHPKVVIPRDIAGERKKKKKKKKKTGYNARWHKIVSPLLYWFLLIAVINKTNKTDSMLFWKQKKTLPLCFCCFSLRVFLTMSGVLVAGTDLASFNSRSLIYINNSQRQVMTKHSTRQLENTERLNGLNIRSRSHGLRK